jgi:hypothetical protein
MARRTWLGTAYRFLAEEVTRGVLHYQVHMMYDSNDIMSHFRNR